MNRSSAATAPTLTLTALLAFMLATGTTAAATPTPGAAPQAPPSKPSSTAASPQNDAQPMRKATAAQRVSADRMDPLARAAFWAHESDIDAADTVAAVKLATALRQLGRFEEADAAATKVLLVDPNNLEALIEVARARISARQGFFAIQPLKAAIALAPKDWRPVSLMGVALEQTERLAEARVAYQQALAISPENPAVLSNLALSYASHGDPVQAEALLRRAVAQPTATSQERQNLALVLGLQGRMEEAERLIREDLPPDLAAANLAYLRSLQKQP